MRFQAFVFLFLSVIYSSSCDMSALPIGDPKGDGEPNVVIESRSSWHDYRGNSADQERVNQVIENHYLKERPVPLKSVYIKPYAGLVEGDGSVESPQTDLISAIHNAEAGTHIYLLPGDYKMSDIAQAHGQSTSMLTTKSSGTRENPIVLSTVPDLFSVNDNQVANIDWQFENTVDNHRTWAFGIYDEYWVVENLEMQNALHRILWVTGSHVVIRNNHLHHVYSDNQAPLDNDGIIVIATSENSYNLIRDNHIHHIGHMDNLVTREITDLRALNIGCTYGETRQHYLSAAAGDFTDTTTYEEIKSLIAEPSGEVYYFNNLLHDCANGISLKTHGQGPIYVLSNYIYDTKVGVKMPKSQSVISNNIIFGKSFTMDYGVMNGYSASSGIISQLYNGVDNLITNNTIVNSDYGLKLYGGHGTEVTKNIFMLTGRGHKVEMNYHRWFNGGGWPAIEGQYFVDQNEDAYYWDNLPTYIKQHPDLATEKLVMADNIYTNAPVMLGEGQTGVPYRNLTYDSSYKLLDEAGLNAQFKLASEFDYRRGEGSDLLKEYGSQAE